VDEKRHRKDPIREIRKTEIYYDLRNRLGEDKANDLIDDAVSGYTFESLIEKYAEDTSEKQAILAAAKTIRPEIESLLQKYIENSVLREKTVNVIVTERAILAARMARTASEAERLSLKQALENHKAELVKLLRNSPTRVTPSSRRRTTTEETATDALTH